MHISWHASYKIIDSFNQKFISDMLEIIKHQINLPVLPYLINKHGKHLPQYILLDVLLETG